MHVSRMVLLILLLLTCRGFTVTRERLEREGSQECLGLQGLLGIQDKWSVLMVIYKRHKFTLKLKIYMGFFFFVLLICLRENQAVMVQQGKM